MIHSIDLALRLVRFDLGPEIPPLPELRHALDGLVADPVFRPGLNVLVEGRHLYIGRAYQRDGLLLLASRLALNADIRRWAFLTSNLTTYRERHLVEAFADNLGIEYRVFMRRHEAMNWVLSLAGARYSA